MANLKSIPDKELVRTILNYEGFEFQTRLMEILRKTQFKDHQKIKNLHVALGEDKEENNDYKRLVDGASKLLKYADDVWIIRNFGDVKTADFVVRYGNMYKYIDQKTVNSFNSIEQEIKKHITQSRRFFLNVAVSCDSKDFAGHVKKCFEQNDSLSEIIVAQGDKYISIQRKDVFNKNYYQILRDTWSKKKRKK
ncbi:MAG: hypothetical protein E7077_06540 [Bacteroidales bacterium]|jgi:hypothetical protein|nr:hypothetical protein [Bacteroidales bacterium]